MFIYRQLFCLFCVVLGFSGAYSQSYWFGVKGGGTYMSQNWGTGFDGFATSDPGFGGCADIFVESDDPDNKGSLYASLGFHSRGSAYQFISFNNDFSARQTFLFRNIGVELGARRPIVLDGNLDPFFTIGIRGEYTVNTNLNKYKSFNSLFYPDDAFVRDFTYGFTIGGGFETSVSDFIKYFFEFSIMPDLAFQYIQPALFNIRDPWTPNQTVDLPVRQARNVSFELKAGIRFLRKVIYED